MRVVSTDALREPHLAPRDIRALPTEDAVPELALALVSHADVSLAQRAAGHSMQDCHRDAGEPPRDLPVHRPAAEQMSRPLFQTNRNNPGVQLAHEQECLGPGGVTPANSARRTFRSKCTEPLPGPPGSEIELGDTFGGLVPRPDTRIAPAIGASPPDTPRMPRWLVRCRRADEIRTIAEIQQSPCRRNSKLATSRGMARSAELVELAGAFNYSQRCCAVELKLRKEQSRYQMRIAVG